MKWLIGIVVAVSAVWAAHWFYVAHQTRGGMEQLFAARQQDGWLTEYADLRIAGFPNRIDITLDAPQIADTSNGLYFTAPFLQIMQLVYKRDHAIVVWPHDWEMATPWGTVDISSTDMRASLVTNASQETRDTTLDRLRLTGENVGLTDDNGWTSDSASVSIALERSAGSETRYRLGAEVKDWRPSFLMHGIENVPDRFSRMVVDAHVTFDAPLNQKLFERRPQPARLEIRLAQANWGALQLSFAGDLDVSPQGLLSGKLAVRAENWRALMQNAVSVDLISAEMAARIERTLALFARGGGNQDGIDIPLTLDNGTVWLSILPLGKLGPLHIP